MVVAVFVFVIGVVCVILPEIAAVLFETVSTARRTTVRLTVKTVKTVRTVRTALSTAVGATVRTTAVASILLLVLWPQWSTPLHRTPQNTHSQTPPFQDGAL